METECRGEIIANHSNVFTKKHITGPKITALLNHLNETVLFGVLIISPSVDETEWHITIVDTRDYRVCWLNSRRHFEIRHGGGSDFIWWIDHLIQDAISKEFNGRVKDDGGAGWEEVLTTWNTPLTFPEAFRKMYSDCNLLLRICFWRLHRRGYSKTYKLALKKMRNSSKVS